MRAKIITALRVIALALVALVAGYGGARYHTSSPARMAAAFGPSTPNFIDWPIVSR